MFVLADTAVSKGEVDFWVSDMLKDDIPPLTNESVSSIVDWGASG
jgi:hypothetical protein